MTDQIPSVPAEQTPAAPQQQTEDYKARFTGAVQKIEQLTIQNRDLTAQLTAKTSEIEQLQAQLGMKDTEKTVAISERDKQLQELVTTKSQLEKEISDLRGLKLKIETIRELGRPDLLKIADNLPTMTDKEALKTVLGSFASYADDAAKEREKQLTAGLTPGFGAPPPQQSSLPTSEAAWDQHINNLPLGSKEREQAFQQKWDWLVKTHQPS